MTASRSTLAAALWLIWTAACSPSDSSRNDRDEAMRDAGSAPVAGNAASTLDDLARLAMPMCDPKIENETSCGDTMCPEVPADVSSAFCTVSCCTPDAKCGTRIADTRLQSLVGTTCVAPATPDPRCPNSAFGGFALRGCCDTTGNCGLLVTTTCLPVPTGAVRCDEAAASDAGR